MAYRPSSQHHTGHTSAGSGHRSAAPAHTGHTRVTRTGFHGTGSGHSGAVTPSSGALRRHIARNPNGLAAQRYGGTGLGSSSSSKSAYHSPSGNALSRYMAGKPNSLAAQRHATASQGLAHRSTQWGSSDRIRRTSAQASGPKNAWPVSSRGKPRSHFGANRGPGRTLGPHPDSDPYDDFGTSNSAADLNVDTGFDGDTGPTGAATQHEPLAVEWQEPTDVNSAIGQPGAGVFIIERAGDDNAWYPLLIGAAPEGFGRRLQYLTEDVGEQEGIRIRLGVIATRPNHPADRTVLRAVAHDLVQRIRSKGADGMLTNRSTPNTREQRLLQQRGLDHGGNAPEYIMT